MASGKNPSCRHSFVWFIVCDYGRIGSSYSEWHVVVWHQYQDVEKGITIFTLNFVHAWYIAAWILHYGVYNVLFFVLQLPLPDEHVAERDYHSVSTLQLGPHIMWLILFGGAPFKSDTIIIELNELVKQQYSLYQMYRWTNSISISLSVQGGDKEWSLGRVLKRDKLSNNTSTRTC